MNAMAPRITSSRTRSCRFQTGLIDLLLVMLLPYLLSSQVSLAAEPDASCAVPPYLFPKRDTLPNTLRRLQTGQTLRVLFAGSGAMAGIGASARTNAFPAQFARLLPERLPNLRLQTTNLAEANTTLNGSVAAMSKQVDKLKPDLVIWQVGINDIAARPPLVRFERDLMEGITLLAERTEADLLLLDVPFYPGLALLLNDAEYRREIEFRAELEGVALFRTHDLMAYWSERRTFEKNIPVEADSDRSRYLADKMHYCLGNLLAAYVARAATKK